MRPASGALAIFVAFALAFQHARAYTKYWYEGAAGQMTQGVENYDDRRVNLAIQRGQQARNAF